MKTDITIRKEATVNTGNYSSVKPSVSLTLKDVDIDKLQKVYENMNIITAAFFLSEANLLCEFQDDAKIHGLRKVLDSLETDEMEKDFKEAIKSLYEDLFLI